jgi:hypothetical protein
MAQARQRAEGRLPDLLAPLAAALVLAGVLALLRQRGIDLRWYLAAHVAVVALLAVRVLRGSRAGRDVIWPLLAAILTAAAGPLGALGAAVGAAYAGLRRPEPPHLLAAWYERIALSTEVDSVTRLCDSVATGRSLDLSGPPPARLLAIMEGSAPESLADQQTALGLIARAFDVEYLPALNAALKNRNPVIRVQAAAVAARVRSELSERVRRIAGSTAEGTAGIADIAALESFISSGLLDAGDRSRAEAALERRRADGRRSLAGDALLAAATATARRADIAAVKSATEEILIGAGRFAELRVFRRAIAVSRGRLYRIRRRARRCRP